MRAMTHRVTAEEAGRTVKSIALRVMGFSQGQFSRLKFLGGITVDGQIAHADRRLTAGETLCLRLPDDSTPALTPFQVPLTIPFADADYFIIDKPAPLPTLCSARQEGPTLENALYAHLGCPENYMFRPVNRLDKGTSGLMAVAQSAHAQQLLQRKLHTEDFLREYRAICRGVPPEMEGVVDAPIGKAGEGAQRRVLPSGKPARTHYWVEEEKNGLSLIRLRLETGRTHQIRVHLQFLGCPILGDYLYGDPHPALDGRFALHACHLRFSHPMTGEIIDCRSPLPPEMERIWREET